MLKRLFPGRWYSILSYLYICYRGKRMMDTILKKLKYGDQERIAILKCAGRFSMKRINGLLPEVTN